MREGRLRVGMWTTGIASSPEYRMSAPDGIDRVESEEFNCFPGSRNELGTCYTGEMPTGGLPPRGPPTLLV